MLSRRQSGIWMKTMRQHLTVKQSSIATVIYLWSMRALLWDDRATEGGGRGLLHTAQPQAFCLGKPPENYYWGSEQHIGNCTKVITVSPLLSGSPTQKRISSFLFLLYFLVLLTFIF